MIALYIILNVILLFVIIIVIGEYNITPFFFTPNKLYSLTKMNIIGCYITSIVFILLFPIYCIPSIIYLLFHIGRKTN